MSHSWGPMQVSKTSKAVLIAQIDLPQVCAQLITRQNTPQAPTYVPPDVQVTPFHQFYLVEFWARPDLPSSERLWRRWMWGSGHKAESDLVNKKKKKYEIRVSFAFSVVDFRPRWVARRASKDSPEASVAPAGQADKRTLCLVNSAGVCVYACSSLCVRVLPLLGGAGVCPRTPRKRV
eukprot:g9325.t1